MMPTVPSGSHCIEDRISYRYRDPDIGDIVLFNSPVSPMDEGKGRAIGLSRIVARGGEIVQVRYGAVFVNGEYREPAGAKHRHAGFYPDVARWETARFSYGVAEPYHVPEGCYFVLGDNRTIGNDSRYYGPLSRKDITGRVTRVYWKPGQPQRAWLPGVERKQKPNDDLFAPKGGGANPQRNN